MTNLTSIEAPKNSHPLVYLLLIIPFGASMGFLTVTIVYLLGRAGVDAVAIAALVALSFLPHTLKFLYAPLVDLTLTRKKWFGLSSITSAISLAMLGWVPAIEANLPWLEVLVLASGISTAFLSMSVESLMAHNTPPEQLGRTGGWFQAGNLGGGGLGGGLALVIAENTTHQWLPGLVLATICLLTGLAVRYTQEPQQEPAPQAPPVQSVGIMGQLQLAWNGLKIVFLDLWQVAKSHRGFLGLFICFLPIGSGAAGILFPLIAEEWGANANDVAVTSGVLSGLLSALGCLVGGYFCDRMDRKIAYCLFGLLMSVCAVGMAWAPHNLSMYYVFVMAYAFITGLGYAAFTAVTLEAIGTGAVATKFSIFASLSNTPIAYMGLLNSYFYKSAGSNAGLYSDAAMGVAGVMLFLLVRKIIPFRKS
jgi:MFS family permease